MRKSVAVLIAACTLAATGVLPRATPARADVLTNAAGPMRDGWDPNEPGLAPTVIAHGFGELYRTPLSDDPADARPGNNVVFAQPVVASGVVIVATEKDRVYGIDEATGQARWAQTVGTYEPDTHGDGCNQVVPFLGITSTPAVDAASGTVYVMARDFLGGSPPGAAWRLHALDITTGAERPGWPVTVAGSAWNRPSLQFDPYMQQQRPGLLLLGGSVFAGFGSYCDEDPFYGWMFSVATGSVSPSTTPLTSLYVDEPTGAEGSFWASGSGFAADSTDSFLASTGNGQSGVSGGPDQPPEPPWNPKDPNDPRPLDATTTNLADSVVRFQVQPDGVTVKPVDAFARAQDDTDDTDLGSSGVSALPDAMGIPGHPHLAVVGGKFGTLYVLDRDNLGGRKANDVGSAVSVLTGTDNLFGRAAAWPGDGGFVFDVGQQHLNAFRMAQDGTLTNVASVAVGYGSGSPIVTSDATTPGSATLWFYERTSGQLRAYLANAATGFTELFAAQVGAPQGASKFIDVASDQGRILVSADDGFLHAFGAVTPPPPPPAPPPPPPHAPADGYWLAAADGGVLGFGSASSLAPAARPHLNRPIVGIAATPDGRGYWLAAADGGVFPAGDAAGYGSLGGVRLNAPVVGIAAVPNGRGYWLVAADGGIFPFGPDAAGFGSTGGVRLNQPVVGMAAAPDGRGYWLVAADGGVFPFGPSAGGYGSTGGIRLNRPAVGMGAAPRGDGYWLVAADGGIFPFGPGARGFGSTGSVRLARPIVGMSPRADGAGYWLVAADGGTFPFGSALGLGSGAGRLGQAVVGVAATG